MNRERLYHALFQAARGARIVPFQFSMDLIQRPAGVGLSRHRVGRDQLSLDTGLVFIRQLLQCNGPQNLDTKMAFS